MNMPPLHTQTALVTGGASGLGLSIARRLVSQGVRVALLDMREDALQEATRSLGENSLPISCDITQREAVAQAVSQLEAQWGAIHILVNSAGITGATNLRSHETDPDDVARVMQINFFGSYHTCHAVLPGMLRQGYGRILNIASIAGKEGNAGMLAYSASKAAVIGMTKSMGKEYAESGITVNALAPAVIQTPMVDAMPEAQVRYMTDKIPMKRCGTLDEIAAMASFIVSPETSFTTGFTFDMTGGRATY